MPWSQADPDGRLFLGAHAGPVTDRTCLLAFHPARDKAFTAAESASPLMTVPYGVLRPLPSDSADVVAPGCRTGRGTSPVVVQGGGDGLVTPLAPQPSGAPDARFPATAWWTG